MAESLYHPGLNLPYPDVDKETAQECSARGCHRSIELNGQNKMCDECRGRHRGYATTKRLRRKLEKAALQAMGVSGEAPIVPMDIEEWDPTIDPMLYDVSRPAASAPGPSISLSSSTSELANALSYYDQDHLAQFQENAPAPEATPCISPAMLQGGSTESTPVPTPGDEDASPARFCSVKGCKAVIPGSYQYKMCPLCRTRYRGYGITKRAKWKNEREAFEKEMTQLRAAEDERRRVNGEPPLSEDLAALKKWEIMVLDEEIPLPPPVLAALKAAGVNADGTLESGSNALSLYQNDPGQPSDIDTPHAIVPYPSVLGSIPQLPARMCTVSHCHQILPGYYRYKRCEQHRLQNRHHSKLKRVREKVEKAIGPTEGSPVVSIPQEGTEPKRRGKASAQEPMAAAEAPEDSENGDMSEPEVKAQPRKKKERKPTHCVTESCGKPLPKDKRWRNCDDCRAEERQKKQRTKVQQRLNKGSPPLAVGPTESSPVPPTTVEGASGDHEAEASSSNLHAQSLTLVNMTADTFESPGAQAFRWSNETAAIAVDSSAPLDLSRPSKPQQPLMIKHYKPKDVENSSGTSSTSQPYVIVEQFPFREYNAIPPQESSGSFEQALPLIPGNAIPATVNRPYPTSGVFRHYVPIPEKDLEPPPIDPTRPAQAPLPELSQTPPLPAPGEPEKETEPLLPPAPSASPPPSASTRKKIAKPKSKRKGKKQEKVAEHHTSNNVAAASPIPQLFQYPHYPIHPYLFLPPQYNPSAVPSTYAYPGYPPMLVPPPPGETSNTSTSPSGGPPASEGTSGTALPASVPQQSLLPVPYPYAFPHLHAAGVPYALPSSASAPSAAGSAGGGVVPPPFFYPYYPYSASAPPVVGFPQAPPSASEPTVAVETNSAGAPGTSVSAPQVGSAPSNSSTSVSAPIEPSGRAPASGTAAKSSHPAKESNESRETRFSYYHHGYGTTDSPDTPTTVSDGTKKRRKIDPAWLEKQRLKAEEEEARKQQLESALAPVPTNPAAGWVGVEVPADSPSTSGLAHQTASEVSTSMLVTDAELPTQQGDSISTAQLVQHPCSNKACKRRVTSSQGTALCDKCKAKFKKHAEKNKRKHRLVPVKPVSATSVGVSLDIGRA